MLVILEAVSGPIAGRKIEVRAGPFCASAALRNPITPSVKTPIFPDSISPLKTTGMRRAPATWLRATARSSTANG